MMKYKNSFFVTIISVLLVQAKEYVPYGDINREYRTLEEKKELFESRNMIYANRIIIDCPGFTSLNHMIAKTVPMTIDLCRNVGDYEQFIKQAYLVPMYVKWINPIIGYGMFAAEDIKQGDFIGIYAGVIRLKDYKLRKTKEDNTDYAWMYPVALNGKILLLDAQYVANDLAFVNHSNTPNAKAVYFLIHDMYVLCYIAKQNIAQNEEITVDFGSGYCQPRNIK